MTSLTSPRACQYCGDSLHTSPERCPIVEEVEYFADGRIRRVKKRSDGQSGGRQYPRGSWTPDIQHKYAQTVAPPQPVGITPWLNETVRVDDSTFGYPTF